jgi:hypothetical protein
LIAVFTLPLTPISPSRPPKDEKRNVSRSFMLVEDGQLLGYYTLANTSVVESDLSG